MTKLRSLRGSAAIEFGLMLPMLLMLLSAVVDWGWYMSQRVAVARATMDATRIGAATFEATSVAAGSLLGPAATARAKDVLAGEGMPCSSPTCVVTVTYCKDGQLGVCASPPFDAVLVEITYGYTPFWGFLPVPSTMYEKFMMAVESQREPD